MKTVEEVLQKIENWKANGTEEGLPMTEEEVALLEQHRRNTRNGLIEQALQAGDEAEAARLISLAGNWNHEEQRMLMQYAGRFTNPRTLYDLIIDVYTNDGYNFPKRLIQTAKRIAKQIPDEHRLKGLPDGNPVTVWRGTVIANPDCYNVLRTDISWTTDKTTAIWFANRIDNPNTANGKGAVWEATIDRSKIIAFTQDRNESEIIQHMNIRNPHLLDIDPEEWEAAIEKHAAEKEAELNF